MTKAPTPTEMSKGQNDNTNNATKNSITERLRTDWGRSVGITMDTQLVWLTWFTGPTFPFPATAVLIQEAVGSYLVQMCRCIVDFLFHVISRTFYWRSTMGCTSSNLWRILGWNFTMCIRSKRWSFRCTIHLYFLVYSHIHGVRYYRMLKDNTDLVCI